MALSVQIDGLPECANVRTILTAKPKTAADFEAVVAALGGPTAMKVGYGGENLVYKPEDGAVYLSLQPPAEAPACPPPSGHPFIREYAEKIKAAKDGGEG
jgi:hypothetical protein